MGGSERLSKVLIGSSLNAKPSLDQPLDNVLDSVGEQERGRYLHSRPN